MPHYFLKLAAPRPTFAADMNDQEKVLMQEHFLYWKGRQERAEVPVFGLVFDPKGAYGMGIVMAEDEAAAKAFAAGDPVMKANTGFGYEIYPMRAATRDNTN